MLHETRNAPFFGILRQSTGKTLSLRHCWPSATWRFAYGARSPCRLFLYGSRYVMKFSTRWRRITHDDRLEAGPFREKITAARSTPDRFVKNAEGIVRGERRKKETRRVHENIAYPPDYHRYGIIFWDERKEKYISSRSLIRRSGLKFSPFRSDWWFILIDLEKIIKTTSNCILEQITNKISLGSTIERYYSSSKTASIKRLKRINPLYTGRKFHYVFTPTLRSRDASTSFLALFGNCGWKGLI